MGSLRPSMRSKASGPIGQHHQQHLPNGHANGHHSNTLRADLTVFESDSFESDAYVQTKCQSMSEKGIRRLCAELQELKKDSAEEMRKSVYANYSAFIRTAREISDLESELVSMRNLLETQETIVHNLAELCLPDMVSTEDGPSEHDNGYMDDEDDPTSRLEREADDLTELIDVCIQERKIEQALGAFSEGEGLIESMKMGGIQERKVAAVEAALGERKVRLAELLTEFSKQPSVRGAELRLVISALEKLGDGSQAHTLLLNAYHQRLEHAIRGLRPNGTSFGGPYTRALSQQVFSYIAQAQRDSQKVFGDQPAFASELMLWARAEVESFANLIQKYVLSASAASGGLRGAAECVQIALGHCSLLEDVGLVLGPVLTKLVKPSVEQALTANLRRIVDSVSVLAAADDWVLQPPQARAEIRGGGGGISFPSHIRLSSSAYRLITMIQEFLDDVMPLTSMHLTSSTLDGVAVLFDSYVHLLMRAIPTGEEEEPTDNLNIRIATTDLEKLALLANAATLSDELLPRAIAKLLPPAAGGVRPELRDFRRRTQRSVDTLRDCFCRKQVLELIYTDDGQPQINADLYLDVDENADADEPSAIFQALFHKFRDVTVAGTEIMPGRERFLTLLLIRFVEYVMLILSTDDYFWEDMAQSDFPMSPKGLQQLILDMHFALQMAGQVNHSSLRHLNQVVREVIDRAVEASGLDTRSLPETNWFVSMAQNAIEKYSTGWAKEPVSPAASISTSSIRSHGSP